MQTWDYDEWKLQAPPCPVTDSETWNLPPEIDEWVDDHYGASVVAVEATDEPWDLVVTIEITDPLEPGSGFTRDELAVGLDGRIFYLEDADVEWDA